MARAPVTQDTLLSVLPADLSAGLFKQSRAVTLATNQMLFVAGDAGDGCYRVEEGLLKVSFVSTAGTERILAVLGAGAIVGELAVIDGAPRSASVTAIRESKLTFVSRADFEAFCEAHPQIYRHISILLARRLREVDGTVAAASFLSLKGRTARAVLNLAEAFGKDVGQGRILIRQKLSQSDLAAIAGIARENVSRILQDWMRRSLISRLAGYYCLEDKAALEREAKG
jgi:CRP-like cAMP-binding protein